MARLIDADAIKYHTETQCCGHGDFRSVTWAHKADIDKMPTIDAVEVVRCKDCGHYHENLCPMWCYTETKPDNFCSYGERRNDVQVTD